MQHLNISRYSANWRIFLALLLVGITSSCNSIIEKDISKETPVMIVPLVGDTITEYSHFHWEEVPGATHYELKIYSPSFSNPSFIAYDTITTAKTLFINLTPNTYEYKLTAYNNGYSSKTLGPIRFVVDTIQDGNQAQINLLMPSSSNFYSANFNGVFNWTGLTGASSYEFSLRKGTNYTTGEILHTQNNISTNSITISGVIYVEGTYIWGIRAYLDNGEATQVFTSTFQIDATPPGTPTLSLPEDQSLVTSPVTLEWTIPADVGTVQSPIQSIVQISTTETFDTIGNTETTSENTTERILPAGTYYWRVYLIDGAGNVGVYSLVREFTIN